MNSTDISSLTLLKTINEQSCPILSLIVLSDGRLASCSYTKDVKIYDINNDYHCDITIPIPGVSYVSQLTNGHLIASLTSDIQILSITKDSFKLEHTIQKAHSAIITKTVELTKERFASCSNDKTIKVFDYKSYSLIKTLEGHKEYVQAMLYIKGKDILLSGSYQENIHIWNLSTYQCETVIKDVYCVSRNSLYQIDDNKVIAGGLNKVWVIDLLSNAVICSFEDYQLNSVFCFLTIKDGSLLCGSRNSSLLKLDIENKKIIAKKENFHDYEVSSLVNINDNVFASGSFDFSIKIWKY